MEAYHWGATVTTFQYPRTHSYDPLYTLSLSGGDPSYYEDIHNFINGAMSSRGYGHYSGSSIEGRIGSALGDTLIGGQFPKEITDLVLREILDKLQSQIPASDDLKQYRELKARDGQEKKLEADMDAVQPYIQAVERVLGTLSPDKKERLEGEFIRLKSQRARN